MFPKLLYHNPRVYQCTLRKFSDSHSCKVLVVGGGAGGCAVAAKLSRQLKQNEVIVIDPADKHYYQPMFTMIGGGIKKLKDSWKSMKSVLPKNAKWIKDEAVSYDPKNNTVTTSKGDKVKYDFLVIGVGLETHYEKIPGLLEALKIPDGGVCSNYSAKYVDRTYKAMQNFQSGNAIFTYPESPVKCPGAPQKIMYITEDYLSKNGKRNKANIIYNTSLPVIFGVKKYADALWKLVKQRNISVNLRTNLIEVKPDKKEAVFKKLDSPNETFTMEYSMLHVTPPQSTPNSLRNCKELTNDAGFVDVNNDTMQHMKYHNVFAIGDCSASPNSKTAAAAAAQCNVVFKNLCAKMSGKPLNYTYDGYASCPLVTGYGKCILAEFDYNLMPLETFPISQDREMYMMYIMKKDIMPHLYWQMMLNGYWNGPAFMRNLMHLKLNNLLFT